MTAGDAPGVGAARAGSAQSGPPPQASAWNIANALTVLRIALVPVFGWLLLYDGGHETRYRILAAAVFALASITDRIDGDIARARGIVTDFGKVSDPIADKALMGMAFVGLSILGELPWWVTIVVLIREIGITVYRFMVVSDHVLAAAWMGKLKTLAQAVALSLALLPLAGIVGDWIVWVNVVTMWIAVILTIASGIDYIVSEVRGKRAKAS